MNLSKEFRKAGIAVFLVLTIVGMTYAQPMVLPDLMHTEVIQGSKEDIGYWGDGNVYVIEIWGTWCAPCIKNIPQLTALHNKYKSKGLRVIGYSWEDPVKVEALLERMGDQMQYYLVNDQEGRFLKVVAEEREMVESFPFSFVIAENGDLVWSGNPSHGLDVFIDRYYANR